MIEFTSRFLWRPGFIPCHSASLWTFGRLIDPADLGIRSRRSQSTLSRHVSRSTINLNCSAGGRVACGKGLRESEASSPSCSVTRIPAALPLPLFCSESPLVVSEDQPGGRSALLPVRVCLQHRRAVRACPVPAEGRLQARVARAWQLFHTADHWSRKVTVRSLADEELKSPAPSACCSIFLARLLCGRVPSGFPRAPRGPQEPQEEGKEQPRPRQSPSLPRPSLGRPQLPVRLLRAKPTYAHRARARAQVCIYIYIYMLTYNQ